MARTLRLNATVPFEVIEYEGPIHPPPHIHREREEAFYVLTGSFTFTLGREEFEVGEGGFVLGRGASGTASQLRQVPRLCC
jgi:mannose-6-phosphate isomerase-like protein (cupin superfamily)